MKKIRPTGKIKIIDARGYAYLPKIIREEVGVQGKDEIGFIIDANCVLLLRKGATTDAILKGLEILQRDLVLRIEEKESIVHE